MALKMWPLFIKAGRNSTVILQSHLSRAERVVTPLCSFTHSSCFKASYSDACDGCADGGYDDFKFTRAMIDGTSSVAGAIAVGQALLGVTAGEELSVYFRHFIYPLSHLTLTKANEVGTPFTFGEAETQTDQLLQIVKRV